MLHLLGLMTIKEHKAQIEKILDEKRFNSFIEVKQSEVDALFDRENEAFKIALFKRVFNTRAGRLILAYLRKMYKVSIPDFVNPSVNYFNNGKGRVIEEIEIIISKTPKKKKEDK